MTIMIVDEEKGMMSMLIRMTCSHCIKKIILYLVSDDLFLNVKTIFLNTQNLGHPQMFYNMNF